MPSPPSIHHIDSALPPGVALQLLSPCPHKHHHHHEDSAQQLGLVATRAFDPDELIFQGRATEIDTPVDFDCGEAGPPYALITVRAGDDGSIVGDYPIYLTRHTTRLPGSATRRLLHDGVASFMNHGCDPSTVVEAAAAGSVAGGVTYDVRAARRLAPGEELTCDYTLAEYDATEKGMDPCCCSAPAGVCLGSVQGFKYLSLTKQLARLGRVSDPLFAQFQSDRAGAVMVLDAREGPPEGLFLDLGGGEKGSEPRVLTTRAVDAGAVLYEGRSYLVSPSQDRGGEGTSSFLYPTVVLVVGPHALPLEPLALFSSAFDAAGTREVYGFDALARHACGARATTVWTWAEWAEQEGEGQQLPCVVRAARALGAGEELTVDFRKLAWRGLRRQQQGQRGLEDVAPPAPAVGAVGFACQCCGRPVFR